MRCRWSRQRWPCVRRCSRRAPAALAYSGVFHQQPLWRRGYYATLAAQQDMIGLSMCNVDPAWPCRGSAGDGHEPIALPCQRRGAAIFLDIATSAVAVSKVLAARFLGKSIPDTWLVDEDGVPTTDPNKYPTRPRCCRWPGHKGYGWPCW